MKDIEQLTEDFTTSPVPDEDVVSGYRIALIVIGIAITLPVLLTGSKIGLALGFEQALSAFVTGSILLAVLGATTAYIGAKTRLSTYMLIQFPFGRVGAKFVNSVIALTLFGWYAVTAGLFGRAADNAFKSAWEISIGESAFTVAGGVLMVATTIWGFKALDKLALVAVPLMLLFLTAVVVTSLDQTSWQHILAVQTGGMDHGLATSLVVGSYIVGAILLPDLSRYARRGVDGLIAAAVSLGIALPAILVAVMIPSLAAQESDLVDLMMTLGLGVPALCMIVFATWTTNANNLYSTSLTLATILTSVQKWKITIVAGLLGALCAMLSVMDHFLDFLLILSLIVPPVAGIFIADFFIVRSQQYDPRELVYAAPINWMAFIPWGVSSCVAYFASRDVISVTTIPALDAILVAAVLYSFLSKASLHLSETHNSTT